MEQLCTHPEHAIRRSYEADASGILILAWTYFCTACRCMVRRQDFNETTYEYDETLLT